MQDVQDGLTLIDISAYPPERVQQLWEKVCKQEYAFDDTMQDDANAFLSQFILPNNLFFEIGDMQGLIAVTGVQPQVAASIHFMIWDKLSIITLRQMGKYILNNLFESYSLNRLNGFIPDGNDSAKRLAVALGFRCEGVMQEAFLHKGKYQDIYIYGLLRREFDRVKEF